MSFRPNSTTPSMSNKFTSEESLSNKSMRSRIHFSVTNEIENDNGYQITKRKYTVANLSINSKQEAVKPQLNEEEQEQLNYLRERMQSNQKSFPVLEIARNDSIRTSSSKLLQSYRKNSFSGW